MSSWAGKFHGKRACFYVNFKKKKKKLLQVRCRSSSSVLPWGLSPSYCYQMISRHSSHTSISQIER